MAVSDHSSMAATPCLFQGFRPPLFYCCCCSIVFVLVIVVSFPAALCDDESAGRVEYLPGFDGPLPFYLETGYIGVGEGEEVQLFYYFVKSESDAEKDGLMLWLTGGPGCSAFSGLIYEIGPLKFVIKDYTNVSLPELEVNPHSWTKASSIIFVDSPVGTGFSYATSQRAYRTGDFEQVRDLNHFMRKWLKMHPEFISNQMYVGGDSYSGFTVPPLVQRIADGNANGEKPYVNIQGYLLGNPVTQQQTDSDAAIPFAHGMGLISDELFESLQSCKSQAQSFDPSNDECLSYTMDYYQCTGGLNTAHILEPFCGFAAGRPFSEDPNAKVRFLMENIFRAPMAATVTDEPNLLCRTYGYTLAYLWTNDENVRKAIHIRKDSIKTLWLRCNFGLTYTNEISSSLAYHANLSRQGFRSLIYSGDHDFIIPFRGTQAWIRSLNYSIVDDWRPWYANGQVGGYTRTYANRMTFATVKGGGHTAPEYRPEECVAMYSRWISEEPL